MDKHPPDEARPQALSAVDAATALGISQRTIRRAIASGELPAVKQNGVYRIEPDLLERYARARRQPDSIPPEAAGTISFDLVRPRAPLIGRARELAELRALLLDSGAPLITLTGPGGVGKTRLALEVAALAGDAFPDGVATVGLAPVRDAGLVAAAIAQQFGLQGGSTEDAVERVVRMVGNQRMLLVLDNFEQVLAAAPEIAHLVQRCPRLAMLCTSRAPLRISDEVEYLIAPMAVPDPDATGSTAELAGTDAVRFFEAKAQAFARDFTITPQNAAQVAAICYRLDGLPLAIELAASRIRVLTPVALLDRLDPRLPMLTGGPKDRPSHQQTVRATIAWSCELLAPQDQALFRQLAVFVGGCSLTAAERVATTPDVLDGLARLIDQSLLHPTTDALGETRYTMLETVREFGLEQLAASPDEWTTRARHADWMLDYATQGHAAWVRPDYALWSDRLEVERGNLRAALSWVNETGQLELALGLAIGSNRFWRTRGPVSEGVDWLERALMLDGEAPPALRAQAMELSADLATVAGNLDLAVRRALEGEALAREIGDALRLNMVLSVRARILFHLGDFETAITILEEALALGPYPACIASDLCNLGVATRMAGDPRKAIELLEAGFALANKIDLTYVASTVIMCLADALRDLGQTERSETLYRDGLARAIEQQEWRNAAIAICGLAVLAANAGDCARAARLCGAADVLLERVGAAMTPGGQECYGEATRLARASLGDDAFERERLAGRLLSPQMVLVDAPGTSPARRGGLTRRELQVLRLLADGRDTREIADALYISPRTVDNHVASMLSKLEVRSRAAAVGVALRNELI